jgi:hypothetical protein
MNINLDFLIPIRDKFLLFINEYKYKIIITVFLIFSLYTISTDYLSGCGRGINKNEIIKNEPIKANYRKDMDFLQCMGEQVECLYKNLDNNIESKIIIEVCGDKNYCSNHNSISK